VLLGRTSGAIGRAKARTNQARRLGGSSLSGYLLASLATGVDPLLKLHQSILRAEIVDQCWLAQSAFTQLQAALSSPSPPPTPGIGQGFVELSGEDPVAQALIRRKMDVWAPAQTILLSAALVSSTLCLSTEDATLRSKADAEAERQRRLSLARLVVDGLPLPPLSEVRERIVRNQLVHTEQKVTKWASAQRLAGNTDPLGSWAWGKGPPPPVIYRWLDAVAMELTVNGKSCNLQKMVDELVTLAMAIPVSVGVDINTAFKK
jgi:hypothetical protein